MNTSDDFARRRFSAFLAARLAARHFETIKLRRTSTSESQARPFPVRESGARALGNGNPVSVEAPAIKAGSSLASTRQ
jgi:hypothetical protein